MPDATSEPVKRRTRAPKAPRETPKPDAPGSPRRPFIDRHAKFMREVGSVVLGVLIALGIGAIADTIGWKLRAANAEQAARRELALIAGLADERAVGQPCLKRRLDEIDGILADARRTGVLPRIGRIGGSGIRPVPRSSISIVVDSEIALHVAADRRRDYTAISAMLPRIDDGLAAEQIGWATLRVLQDAPGPINGDLLASVLIAKTELNHRSYFNGLRMAQTGETIARLGVAPDHFYMLEPGQTWEQRRLAYKNSPLCRPLLVDGKPYVVPTPTAK